jgi:DNA mismatch endonuclease, patch repair protein
MPRFDKLDAAGRSALMATIRKKNSKPEVVVRKLVHAMGYRFRLHRNDLPGTPDLVLPRHRKVIFVHGCFWHRHKCAAGRKTPGKNLSYWTPKLERNRQRDQKNVAALKSVGWTALTIWECELRQPRLVESAVKRFLQV